MRAEQHGHLSSISKTEKERGRKKKKKTLTGAGKKKGEKGEKKFCVPC